MSLPALDNLVRIGQLKAERRNDAEVGRMLAMACKVIRQWTSRGRFRAKHSICRAESRAAMD